MKNHYPIIVLDARFSFALMVKEEILTMPILVPMISPTVVVTAFVEHSLIQDSLNLTDNFRIPVGLQFGFAFVKIVVNSCYVVVLLRCSATDAEQLKCVFSLISYWTAQSTAHL